MQTDSDMALALTLLPANGFCLDSTDSRALLCVCKDTIFSYLANPPIVKVRHGPRGKTRLMHACKTGDLERARWLIEAGSDVNAVCYTSWPWHMCTPLMYAAHSGKCAVVEILLLCGANPNLARDDGFNALHVAAKEGHADIVSLLLSYGALIDAGHSFPRLSGTSLLPPTTPLLLASERGHSEVANILLSQGANVNFVSKDGSTPLILATSTHHVKGSNEQLAHIARQLLAKGALVNFVRWFDGLTALLGACECGRAEIVGVLLDAGASISPPREGLRYNYAGKTPLMAAAQRGSVEICVLLIERAGSEVEEVQSNTGKTALCWASERGQCAVVALLLDRYKANPNHLAKDKWTPLMFAARMAHPEVVKLLKAYGGVAECINGDGDTAKDIALRHGHRAVKNLL